MSGSKHVFPARRLEHVGLFCWVLRISSNEAARPAAPWALLGGAVLKTALRRGWPGAFRERVVTKAVSTVWLAQLERAPDHTLAVAGSTPVPPPSSELGSWT